MRVVAVLCYFNLSVLWTLMRLHDKMISRWDRGGKLQHFDVTFKKQLGNIYVNYRTYYWKYCLYINLSNRLYLLEFWWHCCALRKLKDLWHLSLLIIFYFKVSLGILRFPYWPVIFFKVFDLITGDTKRAYELVGN